MDPVKTLFPSIEDLPRAVHLGTIKRKVLRAKQQLRATNVKPNNKKDEDGKKEPLCDAVHSCLSNVCCL